LTSWLWNQNNRDWNILSRSALFTTHLSKLYKNKFKYRQKTKMTIPSKGRG
jgi:hypothetical protein